MSTINRQSKASPSYRNLAEFKAGVDRVADELLRRHGDAKEEIADVIEFEFGEAFIIDRPPM
jgi:hypothetical protein